MKFKINNEVLHNIPGLQVAVMVFKNIHNQKKTSAATQLLRGACAQRSNQLKNENAAKEIQSLFSKTKVGNKVLSEVQLMESVLRKIAKGKEILPKDNLYNLVNYFGLKFLTPVFGHDLDAVEKDLEVSFIEPKQGKRPHDVIFASDTVHSVIWFLNVGSKGKEEFIHLPDEAVSLVQKYCGGTEAEIFILDAENKEVDLGYESEKEKAYREIAFEEAAKKQNNELETQLNDNLDIDKPPFLSAQSQPINPEPLISEKLKEILLKATNDYLKEKEIEEVPESFITIDIPSQLIHGHYSTNAAMKLAKKNNMPPLDTCNGIIEKINSPELIEKISVAGPGFINFTLKEQIFFDELNKAISYKNNYGRLADGTNKKVIIEYSSPNIAKPLGVHHLLSTILGQTLVNLYKFAGYETIALNWPGDWGTQFGKLIHAYKTWGNEEQVKADPLNELLNLYVKFHSEEEKNPELVEKGREEFKKLEEGDEENNKIWEWFKQISIEELQKIYTRLGVSFDEYLGERMYLDEAKKLIEEGKEKNIIEEGEKGALIIKFEEDKYPPYMLQKADGTTLYSSRDLASLKDRVQRYQPEKILYVVDVAQKLHLQQLFETAKKFGYEGEFVHVLFGRMQLPEGKMSTRKGDIILLEEVIKEAVTRAKAIVSEKSQELTEAEREHLAEQMAISSIKYNIISQNRETNITFDWDKMLTLDGNSAPYMQYVYARAKSIIRKSPEYNEQKIQMKNELQTSLFSMDKAQKADEEAGAVPFGHQKEQELLYLFPHFAEKIRSAVNENKPNILTAYLFDLARAFNSFYNEVHVLTAARQDLFEARLKLVKATAQIMQNGLKVLGISLFEKM
jgi:arginyl-tRNA synthetase